MLSRGKKKPPDAKGSTSGRRGKADFKELKDEEAVPPPEDPEPDRFLDLSLLFKPASGPKAVVRILIVWFVFALYLGVLVYIPVRNFLDEAAPPAVSDRWQLRLCPDLSVHTPSGGGTFAEVLQDTTVHEFTLQISGAEEPVVFTQSSLVQIIGHYFLSIFTLNMLTIGRGVIQMNVLTADHPFDEREWQTVLIAPPNCSALADDPLLLTRVLFRAARRHGLLSRSARESVFDFMHKTAPVASDEPLESRPFHATWVFVSASIVLAFMSALFIVHAIRDRLADEFKKVSDEFGAAYFKYAISKGGFEDIKFDALGPMFFADTLFGDPVTNATKWGKAAVSALIIGSFSLLPTIPYMCTLTSSDIGPQAALAGSCVLFAWGMLSSIQATQYLLHVSWRVRRPVARVYTALFKLLLFLFIVQLILWAFWLVVSIQLNPVQVSMLLTTGGTAILYTFRTIVKIKTVLNDRGLPLLQQVERELLMTRWELVIALIWSLLLVIALSITALIGWVLVDFEKRKISGSYTAGLAETFQIFFVPVAGFLAAARSDKDIDDKVKDEKKKKKKKEKSDDPGYESD